MEIENKGRRGSEDLQIGQLLVKMGCLREDLLKEAIEEQKRREQLGILSAIGEICVENDWCKMRDIAIAMKEQEEEIFRLSSLGQILLNLGFVGPEELGRALEVHAELATPIGETLIELGCCTEEQIRIAIEHQMLYRSSVIRRSIVSRYHPYNVMEFVVNDEIDELIAERRGCFCRACRANVFALALNELPPRYVTDERLIFTFVERYRTEAAELVRRKLEEAVELVKQQPKGTCRGQRFRQDLKRIAVSEGFREQVPVHVANRHVHLCAEHRDALFGKDYALTKWKDLGQPGQFAAMEAVTLAGAQGTLAKVRVHGPLRPATQAEISGTDQYVLGLRVPVRDSGNLEGTPGIRMIGPAGEITTNFGLIRALRHIHLSPADAQRIGVQDREIVDVRLNGDRTTVCEGVLIQVSAPGVLEMHIDTDEANAAGVPSESIGDILGPSFRTPRSDPFSFGHSQSE